MIRADPPCRSDASGDALGCVVAELACPLVGDAEPDPVVPEATWHPATAMVAIAKAAAGRRPGRAASGRQEPHRLIQTSCATMAAAT